MIPSAVWLILLVVLVTGEAITVGLTFIWFAVGALSKSAELRFRLTAKTALRYAGTRLDNRRKRPIMMKYKDNFYSPLGGAHELSKCQDLSGHC